MMTKTETYQSLLPQIRALMEGETDTIAKMANVAAVLHHAFGFWWVGFYRVQGDELVLGPFQGPVACMRIKKGRVFSWLHVFKGETFVDTDDIDAACMTGEVYDSLSTICGTGIHYAATVYAYNLNFITFTKPVDGNRAWLQQTESDGILSDSGCLNGRYLILEIDVLQLVTLYRQCGWFFASYITVQFYSALAEL